MINHDTILVLKEQSGYFTHRKQFACHVTSCMMGKCKIECFGGLLGGYLCLCCFNFVGVFLSLENPRERCSKSIIMSTMQS